MVISVDPDENTGFYCNDTVTELKQVLDYHLYRSR